MSQSNHDKGQDSAHKIAPTSIFPGRLKEDHFSKTRNWREYLTDHVALGSTEYVRESIGQTVALPIKDITEDVPMEFSMGQSFTLSIWQSMRER